MLRTKRHNHSKLTPLSLIGRNDALTRREVLEAVAVLLLVSPLFYMVFAKYFRDLGTGLSVLAIIVFVAVCLRRGGGGIGGGSGGGAGGSGGGGGGAGGGGGGAG